MKQKTLIFCTAFSSPERSGFYTWGARYRTWVDGLRQSGLNFDQILLVDDGSSWLPSWRDTVIIDEGDNIRSDAPIVLFHFRDNLGRRGVSDFPGWVRSFFFASTYARANGFEKLIHIESDGFLISDRIQEYFNSVSDGWVSLWCPRYRRPESGMQIIAGGGMKLFDETAAQPVESLAGCVVETTLPFTHVEHGFRGDRYREFMYHVPRDADWSMQTFPPEPVSQRNFYWWFKEPALSTREILAIDFTSGGNSLSFVREGWSEMEPHGTWTVGKESKIVIPLPAGLKNCHAAFVVRPCTSGTTLPSQRVSFVVGSTEVCSNTVSGLTRLEIHFPDDVAAGQDVEIRILHPDATSPLALGVSGDTRELAILVVRVEILGEESAADTGSTEKSQNGDSVPPSLDSAPSQAGNAAQPAPSAGTAPSVEQPADQPEAVQTPAPTTPPISSGNQAGGAAAMQPGDPRTSEGVADVVSAAAPPTPAAKPPALPPESGGWLSFMGW